MNIRDFEISVVRNPLVYGVFSFVDPHGIIAPGVPEFVTTDDEFYVVTDDGEFVTTG
jgi:hypothetical protein